MVQALKRGWWVLLDEVNLAEPQILERLNSVLERDPTLVLTEHDHSAFGPGGRPVHADFRVFATMNPAEYVGPLGPQPGVPRPLAGAPLHPAAAARPSTGRCCDYLVFGRQPEVTVLGRTYPGAPADPPRWRCWPRGRTSHGLLPALASFHAALEQRAAARARRRPGSARGARSGTSSPPRAAERAWSTCSPFGGAAGLSPRGLRKALLRYYPAVGEASGCRATTRAWAGPAKPVRPTRRLRRRSRGVFAAEGGAGRRESAWSRTG